MEDAVEERKVEEEMEKSYIDYSMSVIVGRALPDARDGLKPVQRRVLYTMYKEGMDSNSGHRKSSSVVGTTMSDFHPHGDKSIYDALVRMAQSFSTRYPLIDGQGNFGSTEDPPAAMRYTEARLSPLSEELLKEVDEGTVKWKNSYDGRNEEPEVLPASFPNLLANGASGIAVGMSTNIPPHNLKEVINACIYVIKKLKEDIKLGKRREEIYSDIEIKSLMNYIKGPDFPTGGKISGKSEIEKLYKTGNGKLNVRGKIKEENKKIIIQELPYRVDKSKLVEQISELDEVVKVRDESDREGIRIVVKPKRSEEFEVFKRKLFTKTQLETTFGATMLALVDGEPELLDLKDSIRHFLDHRLEIVRKRSQQELKEARKEEEILEARLQAIRDVDSIIQLIRKAEGRDKAVDRLEDYGFNQKQAKHVARMRLSSLTTLREEEMKDRLETVKKNKENLQTLLESELKLLDKVKEEIKDLKEKSDERRTSIEEAEEIDKEELISEREELVVSTREGYIKRTRLDEFTVQRRGGKGIIGIETGSEDEVSIASAVETLDYMFIFTDKGRCYPLKVYEIPETGRRAKGDKLIDSDEKVTSFVSFEDNEGYRDKKVVIATKKGYVKRVNLDDLLSKRKSIKAASLEKGDEIIGAAISSGKDKIMIETKNGSIICFNEREVREMGRSARGVVGIDLQDDEVVDIEVVDSTNQGKSLLTITSDGYSKRTPLSEYKTQRRGGKGLRDIETKEGVSSINIVDEKDEVIGIGKKGQALRTEVDEISKMGRRTKGVKFMDIKNEVVEATVRK